MNRSQKQKISEIMLKELAKGVSITEKYPLTKTVVIFMETVIFIFMLLTPNISQKIHLPEIQIVLLYISQVVFWVIATLEVITLICVTLAALRGTGKQIEVCLNISYLFIQVFLIVYLVSSLKMIQGESSVYAVIVTLIILPLTIFRLYLQQTLHLFGMMSIPVIGTYALFPFGVWKLCFFAVIVIQAFKSSTLAHKLACFSLGFTQIWAFCFQVQNKLTSFGFVSYAMMMALIVLSTLYLGDSLITVKDETFLINLISKAQDINKDIKSVVELNFEEKKRIYQILENQSFELQDYETNNRSIEQSILNGTTQLKDIFDLVETIVKRKQEKWLKADIEIMKNQNILKTFRLIGEIRPEGLLELLRLQQFKQRAENNNRMSFDKKVDVEVFQEANAELEAFYEHSYCSLEALAEFWTEATVPVIRAEQLSLTFSRVIQSHQSAQKCLSRINFIHFCPKEQEIHVQIQKLINHYYEQDNTTRDKNLLDSDFFTKKLLSYDYLLLQANHLKKMSPRLIISLNLQEYKVSEISENDIFNPKITKIINEKYEKYWDNQFFIPLIVKNQRIVVKKATIHLLVGLGTSIQHLYILRPCDIQVVFLYDLKKQSKTYFSEEFNDFVKKGDSYQNNRSVSGDSFQMDLTQEIIQLLQQGSSLNCEINYESLIFCKSKNKTDFTKAVLQSLCEFQDEKNHFILLELKSHVSLNSLSKYKSKGTGKIKKIAEFKVGSSEDLDSLVQQQRQYKDQIFFCKIKNPYQEYIWQKVQNHKRNKAVSNSVKIMIVVIVTALLTVAMIAMILNLTYDRHTNYLKYLEEGKDLSVEHEKLINLFYESYFRSIVHRHPEKAKEWLPNLNIDATILYYYNSITRNIKSIMEEEFNNPLQKLKPEVNYTWNHALYNISATSRDNNIVELAQEVKRSLVTFDLTFLIDNYQTVRSFSETYMVEALLSSLIEDLPHSSDVLILTCLSLASGLTLLIYILLIQAKGIIQSINSYLTKITQQSKLQMMKKIQENALSRYPILSYYDSLHKKRCSSIITRQIRYFTPADKEQKSDRVVNENPLRFLSRNYIYLVFLLFIIFGGVVHKNYTGVESDSFIRTVNYLQSLHRCADFIIIHMTDSLSSAAWKEKYNTSRYYGQTDNITLRTSMKINQLPEYYKDYKLKHIKYFLQSICLFDQYSSNILLLQGVKCENVFKGNIQRGFPVISEIFRNNVAKLKEYSLQDIFEVYRPGAVYPLIIQTGYIRRVAIGFLSQLSSEFIQVSKGYSLYLQNQVRTFVWLGYILCACMAVMMISSALTFRRRCHLYLNLLRTIPRETLFNIKFTKEMIKTNFLNSLTKL